MNSAQIFSTVLAQKSYFVVHLSVVDFDILAFSQRGRSDHSTLREKCLYLEFF